MIYPVIMYHDVRYCPINKAEGHGFGQALEWFNMVDSSLPPTIQYRTFHSAESGDYSALLTLGTAFPDRTGRHVPTKLMLVLDSGSADELMRRPRCIPALAAYMRRHLARSEDVREMPELPELKELFLGEDKEGEAKLICKAVRGNAEKDYDVCYVTGSVEALFRALEALPEELRRQVSFAFGWKKGDRADWFDVIVTGAEDAPVLPRAKQLRTVRDAAVLREEEELTVAQLPRARRRAEPKPRREKADRPHTRARIGRILGTLVLLAATGGLLWMNTTGFTVFDRIYINISVSGNDLINAVLLVLGGFLLGKLCCQMEVKE